MTMTKQDFIELADSLRPLYNQNELSEKWIAVVINYCKRQNPAFKAERWLDYLKGECGPSGGKVKHKDQ